MTQKVNTFKSWSKCTYQRTNSIDGHGGQTKTDGNDNACHHFNARGDGIVESFHSSELNMFFVRLRYRKGERFKKCFPDIVQ